MKRPVSPCAILRGMVTAQEIMTAVEEANLTLTTDRVQFVSIGDNSHKVLEVDQPRPLRSELKVGDRQCHPHPAVQRGDIPEALVIARHRTEARRGTSGFSSGSGSRSRRHSR